MTKNRFIILLLLILSNVVVQSQNLNETAVRKYVEMYAPIAVTYGRMYNIPSSILLAQALLYTKAGTNHLAKVPNNHMAVTCTKADVDNRYHQDNNTNNICFKKYATVEESYNDYLHKIKENSLYTPLFKLSNTDYKGWANGLQKIGHSTNANYGGMLISLIETYHLDQYDSSSKDVIPEPKSEPVQIEMPIQVVIDPSLLEVKKPNEEKPIEVQIVQEQQDTIKIVSIPKVENESPAIPADPITSKEKSQVIKMADTVPPLKSKVYIINDVSKLTTVYYPYTERPVYVKEGIKFIIAAKNDSFEKIGKSVQLPETHLRLYNDVYDYKYQPEEGEVVYIQKKNKKCNTQYHTIEMGESLRYISQLYGVRLEMILEKNDQENIGVGFMMCISCKK